MLSDPLASVVKRHIALLISSARTSDKECVHDFFNSYTPLNCLIEIVIETINVSLKRVGTVDDCQVTCSQIHAA